MKKNILSIETIYIRRGDIGVKKTPTISESFLRLQTRRREQDEDNDQTQGKEHKYTIQKKLKTQMDSPESTPSAPLSPSTTMTSTHSDTTAAYFLTPEQKWMMQVRNEQSRHYLGPEKFTWDQFWIEVRDPKLYFR